VWIDENLQNVFKQNDNPPVRSQQATYEYLKGKMKE
jgi:hypothetical protein